MDAVTDLDGLHTSPPGSDELPWTGAWFIFMVLYVSIFSFNNYVCVITLAHDNGFVKNKKEN